MKAVRFLRPAEQEMLDAAGYYETQAVGLGDDFLDKIDSPYAISKSVRNGGLSYASAFVVASSTVFLTRYSTG